MNKNRVVSLIRNGRKFALSSGSPLAVTIETNKRPMLDGHWPFTPGQNSDGPHANPFTKDDYKTANTDSIVVDIQTSRPNKGAVCEYNYTDPGDASERIEFEVFRSTLFE